MKIWKCGSSPRSGSWNAWKRIKNVNGASRLNRFGIFSARSKWFPLAIGDMDETWLYLYDPETKQQSMGWRRSGSPHPKIFRVQKSAEKVLTSIFFWIKTVWYPPVWLSSKVPNYQRGVSLTSAGAIEGHFEGKTPREGHQGVFVLTWQCRGSLGTAPRSNWPIWASNVLITHPILRIWPSRTTTCSLDW